MLRQICCSLFLAVLCAGAQDANYKIVFRSREYKAVGRSYPQSWSMTLSDRQKAPHTEGACTPQEVRSEPLPSNVRVPERGDHWNYLTSVSPSPDGMLLLVGSEAGSSDSHFEDYWLLDRNSGNWQYAGGGNEAKWSPDSSKILWSTPRILAPLGKIRVWSSHLVMLDVRTLQQQTLTSGVSEESNFFWCTSGRSPIAELRDRFEKAAPAKPADLSGTWVLIRHVMTEKFIRGSEGPDHTLFNPEGVRSAIQYLDGLPRSSQENQLEWVIKFNTARSLQATSNTVWGPTGDTSRVTLTSSGDAVFEKDYGGDSAWIYRCRLATPRNLICLIRGHEDGHGIEFLRTAQ